MKKVYLVVNHTVQDASDFGIGTSCYDSYEKAQKIFKEIVEDEKRAIDGCGWVIETDNSDTFLAHDEGYYVYGHSMVEIREIVIE